MGNGDGEAIQFTRKDAENLATTAQAVIYIKEQLEGFCDLPEQVQSNKTWINSLRWVVGAAITAEMGLIVVIVRMVFYAN